jgi:hypothetical protein
MTTADGTRIAAHLRRPVRVIVVGIFPPADLHSAAGHCHSDAPQGAGNFPLLFSMDQWSVLLLGLRARGEFDPMHAFDVTATIGFRKMRCFATSVTSEFVRGHRAGNFFAVRAIGPINRTRCDSRHRIRVICVMPAASGLPDNLRVDAEWSARHDTEEDSMNADLRTLTGAELDHAFGAQPNLGGYTYCNKPGVAEGLYVGGCPYTMIDLLRDFTEAATGKPAPF